MSERLVFDQVSFHEADKALLGPIDLDLAPSNVTAILGPNGSGKSLFLSLCHGTLQPSAGKVSWNGKAPRVTRKERGYIFQKPVVMRRSVAANISFALSGLKLSKDERISRVSDLLSLVKLDDKADQPAAVLSGGEGQKMALARALATNPNALLMDEPTSNLDPDTVLVFEEIISQLAQSGMPVFWATHDLVQARRIASYVIFISGGKIAEHGPTNEFFRSPRSEEAKSFLEGHMF